MAAGDSGYQGGGDSILTNFYNTLRQDQYRRDQQDALKEQARIKRSDQTAKDLEAITSKLNLNGIRDADRPEIIKKYEEGKAYKAMAKMETDPLKRADNMADFQRTFMELGMEADDSREMKKGRLGVNKQFVDDVDSFDADQRNMFVGEEKLTTKELKGRDGMRYAPRVNGEEVMGSFRKDIDELLKLAGSKPTYQDRSFTRGTESGTETFEKAQVLRQEGVNRILKRINTDPKANRYIKQMFPDVQDVSVIADNLFTEFEKEKRTSYEKLAGTTRNSDGGSGETKAEGKAAVAKSQRVTNIDNIVDKKDQTTFEAFKASLPLGSTLGWSYSVGTGQKMKAEGRKFPTTGEIIGVKISVPTFFNQNGDRYEKINEVIDFRQGDPKKKINTLINTYYGKNIENEDLGTTNKRATTTKAKPKASTGGTKPKKGVLD